MKPLDAFIRDISNLHSSVLNLLTKAEQRAIKSGDPLLARWFRREHKKIAREIDSLQQVSTTLRPAFQKELKKRTQRLETKIEGLTKVRENLISDNYLLEYKKKDLLLVTHKLEEAYEEITQKNEELLQQQEKIAEQTDKLNTIHQEILEKNRELEQQKESLLDQSDYLHEANQAITMMHQEVQQQKEEIERKNVELLNLNNEKNNLIGIVAHDLKSPLNQIRGLLGVMKIEAKALNGQTSNYIDMMEQSASRLTNMIAKILDVEAIESQKLNLCLERVDLSRMLQQIIERHQLVAQEKTIIIHTSIQPEVFVEADRGYADQVFENLVSNAVKFSPQNRNIFVTLQCNKGKAIAEIRDEGPGLTEDDKRKLFGKYQKLSARPTGNETSTGLGLSIVKKFVDAMQGEIWCESEFGKGASFFVGFASKQ